MVQCRGNCTSGTCRLLLHPNRPLNWRGSQGACLLICIPCLGFATVLTALGFWPILLIAGLELALLYGAFYQSSLRQFRQEELDITEREIILIRTTGRRANRTALPRAWTHLLVQRDPRHWYPDRIYLRYCGQMTEIGADLTDREKRQLARTLGTAGITVARENPGDPP